MKRVYLDYAATTFVRDEVIERMMPFFNRTAGNPSSPYESGREAKRALETAREEIAACIGAKKNEIYFTSGGTESDNWALRGMLGPEKRHIVTTSAEHHAVIDACGALEREGVRVTYLPVNEYGQIAARQVEEAVCGDTALISAIYANNEVGSINPIAEIGETARKLCVPFHTDAVAAAGHLPIDVRKTGIDLLSISAHKFYGPKGVGILYCKDGLPLRKLFYGGKQERNLRPGTEQVQGAVGLAAALGLAVREMEGEERRIAQLRDLLRRELERTLPGICFPGHPTERLAGNLHLLLPDISSEAALVWLDMRGIECSAGSACTSGSIQPSHVLAAMGIEKDRARCALRLTLGRGTTEEDILITARALGELCERKKIRNVPKTALD